MKKQVLLLMAGAWGVLGITGCIKEPLNNMTASESRIYITNRDSTADFTAYSTFSIVDSVTVIDNNNFAGKQITATDAAFIDAVRNEMQARGYAEVSKDANPDLGINISRIYNTYTGVMTYPNYWGMYDRFYDPFYWGYGGYPYYFPPLYSYYQVTEGALSVDILDLKDAPATQRIKGLWQGLIRGSGIFSQDAGAQVKALFDQSAYLGVNQ